MNTPFQNAKFVGSFPSNEDLPLDEGSEIAFAEDLTAENQASSMLLQIIKN